MKVLDSTLAGVLILDAEPIADERGFFARIWDREQLESRGQTGEIAESSIAYNAERGTLRGLHYQDAPHAEAKTVRCTAGAIYDVAVDLRDESPTRFQWVAVELTADGHRSLFIPGGFAHGYLTLTDHAEVMYQMSAPYRAEAARGIRWDDATLGIDWPIAVERISERDGALPYLFDA
jgi:dTDP-4-dehydrorhamnose 3,5-epimerase